MTTFREAVNAIPFAPTDSIATGLLAPIMRAAGHILYLVGAFAEPGYTLTDDEVRRELEHAAAHLVGTRTVAEQAPISSTIRSHINAFIEAVTYAGLEYPEWPEDERGPNLKDLADRTAALGSAFDLELAGIRHSNPGRTL